jgi:hypothetical protein
MTLLSMFRRGFSRRRGSGRIALGALIAFGLATASLAPANAATAPAAVPTPPEVTAGGAVLVEHHQQSVGGQLVEVYTTRAPAVSVEVVSSPAAVTAATTRSYSDWGQQSYYLSGHLAFWMKDTVTWTGDGKSKVTTTKPVHRVTHDVTALGKSLLQVTWKGVVDQGDNRVVNSSGALWDSFREGKFQQCIMFKGCTTNVWYPYIHEALYGNGGSIIRPYA